MKDDNKSQAAIRAGYSPKTARNIATRLFTNVHIRARVEFLRQQRAERCDIEVAELDAKLIAQALFAGDPSLPEAAGVAEIEVEYREVWTKEGVLTLKTTRFRTPDRIKATVELYKRKGAYIRDDGPPQRPGGGGFQVFVLAGPHIQIQPPAPGQMVNGVMVLSKPAQPS